LDILDFLLPLNVEIERNPERENQSFFFQSVNVFLQNLLLDHLLVCVHFVLYLDQQLILEV
jgi:hypothetical protein